MGVLLEANNVSKFFGKLKAVNNVSFKIDKGEILGLVGPNGAGKSTFFNLLSGYHSVDEGQVLFEGKDITNNKPYQSAKIGLSRTFQIVRPFAGMTTLENVMVGAFKLTNNVNEARERSKEVIIHLKMKDKMNTIARSLTLVDRKRLEVARALVMGPKLLMLDEVMAGLNRTEVNEILPLIRDISKQGVAIIVVEHIMYIVMSLAERITVLNEGKKIADGTPSEIACDKNVINAYLGEEYLLAKS